MYLEYKLDDNKNESSVEIINEQGRQMKNIPLQGREGTLRVSVSDFKNGIYYYKLNPKRGTPRTRKVMILK